MAKEYEFTSGQLWALHGVLGIGAGKNTADASRRISLLRETQFTRAEQEAINWRVQLGQPGQPDQTRFKNDVMVTRRFTPAKKKKLIEVALEMLPQLRTDHLEQRLCPALEVLGYKFPEADWGDEEDDE